MIDRNYAWYLKSSNDVPYAYHKNYFTQDECEAIIQYGTSIESIESYVGEEKTVDNSIRKNRVCFLRSDGKECHWIFNRVRQAITDMNQQFWQYDLDMIEVLQFTRYDRTNDFYGPHMDMGFGRVEQRKLSFSIQLSESDSYTGSDLQFHSCGMNFYDSVRDRGTIIMFPSYIVHQVTPLLSGQRYSLVGWVLGPPFK